MDRLPYSSDTGRSSAFRHRTRWRGRGPTGTGSEVTARPSPHAAFRQPTPASERKSAPLLGTGPGGSRSMPRSLRERAPSLTPVSVALAVVVSGCSTEDSAPVASPTPAPVRLERFDPPTKFSDNSIRLPKGADGHAGGGLSRGSLPVALTDDRAFVATRANVRSVSLTSPDSEEKVTTPELEPAYPEETFGSTGTRVAEAPVSTKIEGKKVMLAPFIVKAATAGTEKPRKLLELIAIDASTSDRLWSMTTPFPKEADHDVYAVRAGIVGIEGTTAIVSVVGNNGAAVVAIDLSARTQLWSRPGFTADSLNNGLIVGVSGYSATSSYGNGEKSEAMALALKDGAVVWRAKTGDRDVEELQGSRLGSPVAIVSFDYSDESLFIDVRTGQVLGKAAADESDQTCVHDGRSTIVCATPVGFDAELRAYDATTRKLLFSLPTATRTAPHVTTVWHGAIYGQTNNGPLVVDARSGKDREISPGQAPSLVTDSFGVGMSRQNGEVVAYRAVGG